MDFWLEQGKQAFSSSFFLSFPFPQNSKLGNFVSSKENKPFIRGVYSPRIDEGTLTTAFNGANKLRLRLCGGRLRKAASTQRFNFETLCNTRLE